MAVGVVFVCGAVCTICAPRVKIGVNTSDATAAAATDAGRMAWYLFEWQCILPEALVNGNRLLVRVSVRNARKELGCL